jgi:hypothetical protein
MRRTKRRRKSVVVPYSYGQYDAQANYSSDINTLNQWAAQHLPGLVFTSEVPDGHCYYYAIARQMHPDIASEAEPATWVKRNVIMPKFISHARHIFAQGSPEPDSVEAWKDQIIQYLQTFMYVEDDNGRKRLMEDAAFDAGMISQVRNAANAVKKRSGSVEDLFAEIADRVYKHRVLGRDDFPFVNMLDIQLLQQDCLRPILTFQVTAGRVTVAYVDNSRTPAQGEDFETAIAILRTQNPIILAFLRFNGSSIHNHYGSGTLGGPASDRTDGAVPPMSKKDWFESGQKLIQEYSEPSSSDSEVDPMEQQTGSSTDTAIELLSDDEAQGGAEQGIETASDADEEIDDVMASMQCDQCFAAGIPENMLPHGTYNEEAGMHICAQCAANVPVNLVNLSESDIESESESIASDIAHSDVSTANAPSGMTAHNAIVLSDDDTVTLRRSRQWPPANTTSGFGQWLCDVQSL